MAGENMKNILIINDNFILAKVINVIYILAVVCSIVFGVYAIFATDFILVFCLFFIFAMPFIIRLFAEMFIVLLSIYKKMQLISELKAKKLQREKAGE